LLDSDEEKKLEIGRVRAFLKPKLQDLKLDRKPQDLPVQSKIL